MVQLILFGIALCVGTYGALSGHLPSLLISMVTMLAVTTRLVGDTARQSRIQQIITKGLASTDWVIVSVLALTLAIFAAYESIQNRFTFTSSYFWLAGLLAIIGAAYLYDYRLKQRMAANHVAGDTSGAPAIRLDRWDWMLLVGLTAVALGLRLYRLSDFLPTMHGDEGEMGMLALLARHGPTSGISPLPLPLFATAFLDHPTLFHYLQAAALWLFGESLQGLRILSVIFGALCVPVVYGIGRLGWGRIAGMTAGWLLAVSHFHLHYSRIALNNIETVWFTALFIFLLMVAAEKTQWVEEKAKEDEPKEADQASTTGGSAKKWQMIAPLTPFLWAGLVMGLSQYFYYGSRLLPVLAAPLLLVLWMKRRLTFAQLFIFTVATLVAYAPLAGHYWQNLDAFLNRTKGVSVINPEGMAHILGPQGRWPQDIPWLVWEQVKHNVAFFGQDGDRSSFYLADLSGFDPITIALFWFGLGVVLARLRRFHEFAIFLWLTVGLLLAGVLTNDAPNGPRLVVMTTTVYITGGIFLQRLFNFSRRLWPMGSQWGTLLLGVTLAAAAWQMNFTTYFDRYASYTPNLLAISLAHDMRDLGANTQVYFFGAPSLYADYGVLRFVARDIERFNAETVDQLPAQAELTAAGHGLLAIALPNHLTALEQVIARFPGGVRTERIAPTGQLLYVIYQAPGPIGEQEPHPANTATRQSVSPLMPPSPLQPIAVDKTTP